MWLNQSAPYNVPLIYKIPIQILHSLQIFIPGGDDLTNYWCLRLETDSKQWVLEMVFVPRMSGGIAQPILHPTQIYRHAPSHASGRGCTFLSRLGWFPLVSSWGDYLWARGGRPSHVPRTVVSARGFVNSSRWMKIHMWYIQYERYVQGQ